MPSPPKHLRWSNDQVMAEASRTEAWRTVDSAQSRRFDQLKHIVRVLSDVVKGDIDKIGAIARKFEETMWNEARF